MLLCTASPTAGQAQTEYPIASALGRPLQKKWDINPRFMEQTFWMPRLRQPGLPSCYSGQSTSLFRVFVNCTAMAFQSTARDTYQTFPKTKPILDPTTFDAAHFPPNTFQPLSRTLTRIWHPKTKRQLRRARWKISSNRIGVRLRLAMRTQTDRSSAVNLAVARVCRADVNNVGATDTMAGL